MTEAAIEKENKELKTKYDTTEQKKNILETENKKLKTEIEAFSLREVHENGSLTVEQQMQVDHTKKLEEDIKFLKNAQSSLQDELTQTNTNYSKQKLELSRLEEIIEQKNREISNQRDEYIVMQSNFNELKAISDKSLQKVKSEKAGLEKQIDTPFKSLKQRI